MWVAVVVILVTLLYLGFRKPHGFPPGPVRLPLVGYLPFMDNNLPHKHLTQLSDVYGPVVGLFFGNQRTIVVNGWKAVKEALMNDNLNGRPKNIVTEMQYSSQQGVMFTEGELWTEQRRFTLHHFRNLGFGKRSHEAVVQDEARELVKEIQEAQDSISLPGMLGVSSINILWAVMGGTRFDRSDARLWELVSRLNKLFRAGELSGGIVQSFPILRHVVSKKNSFNIVLSGFLLVNEFIKEAIDEHRQTLDPENPRDFIDMYLLEMEKQKGNSDSTFVEKQLLATCSDIFSAGTETGSATVSFAILLMALHPEVMRKVQEEIDEVVGHARLPSIEDRGKLAFTEATLSEVFRFRNAAPFTVPHKAMTDTTLQGWNIPAGTFVLVNLYSVLMETEYWGDPENFRPERFLNADGSFCKEERLIPFGKGRRVCLGEPLARMTSFIIFTTLLQHFTFSLDPAVPVPCTEGKAGFTLGPPDFRVFSKPRL